MTPAVATGVTDRLSDVEDFVAAWEPRAEDGKSDVMIDGMLKGLLLALLALAASSLLTWWLNDYVVQILSGPMHSPGVIILLWWVLFFLSYGIIFLIDTAIGRKRKSRSSS